MRTVPAGPATGLVASVALLAGLDGAVGLTGSGWAVGVACGLTTFALVVRALARSGAGALGRANGITLVRAALAGGVAALVVSSSGIAAALTAVVALAAVGLALDAVDGWTARRTGTVTELGARFDGEVDAFLILALSVLVARSLGAWVLAIGLMRYVFLVAGVLPWMRARLPRRDWRKTVAAVQGVVLTVAAAGVLPAAWARAALALALVLLVESFGRDVVWLWRARTASATAPRHQLVRTPRHARARLVVRRTTGVAAAGLLWVVLLVPDRLSAVTPTTFLRIPVEALAVVAVAVVLPRAARTSLAVLVGLALTGVTVVRALDVGFARTLDRPFDPVSDWQLLGPAVGVVSDSSGQSRTTLVAGVTALLVVVLLLLTSSAVRVTGLAARHRTGSLRAVAVLGVVWAVCAVSAVTTGAGAPVAAAGASELVATQVQLVRTGLRDQRAFSREVSAPDRFDRPAAATALSAATAATAPSAPRLLGGLQGKDVLLVFVEAYGRVALEGTAVAPAVTAVLDQATAGLRAAGISSRSAYLTSPVFGGGSWLAHATLQSGLWIDDEARYDHLLGSGRLTLTAAFRQAGWRTVLSIPSSPSPWPEGQAFYRFDVMYGTEDLGYDGPAFSFAQVPDQFTLHALHVQELAGAPRRPVMAEVDLVSSHAPWAPLPRLVPWQDLGDGEVFEPMPDQGRTPAQVLRSAERTAAAYGESIAYSLTSLVSYLSTFPDRDRVVVMLGDHQPTAAVPGSEANRDVPITILAQDPTVLSRIASWGWHDGVRPGPDAPVWRMDEFRDRFLTAYATPTGRSPAARRSERE